MPTSVCRTLPPWHTSPSEKSMEWNFPFLICHEPQMLEGWGGGWEGGKEMNPMCVEGFVGCFKTNPRMPLYAFQDVETSCCVMLWKGQSTYL